MLFVPIADIPCDNDVGQPEVHMDPAFRLVQVKFFNALHSDYSAKSFLHLKDVQNTVRLR